MTTTMRRDERAYRRGLVMGLTLAEVMLLVLFALLLILGWTIKGADPADAALGTVLRPLLPANVQEQIATPGQLDNTVRELATSATIARAVMATLSPPAESLSEKNATELVARVKTLIELGKHAEASVGPNSTAMTSPAAAHEILTIAGSEYEKARHDRGVGSARIWLEWLMKNQKTADGGNGLVFPSCVAEVNGRPPYVFDVTLRSDTLLVKDNQLPQMLQWADEVKSIQFDRGVIETEFRAMTAPLFEWSRAHQCRFFVRVLDSTAAHEKAIYKAHLRTVEDHFYKFLADGSVPN